MAKMKKVLVEGAKSKPEKKDILTEMFESFGIKVIEVTNQNSKSNSKKRLE